MYRVWFVFLLIFHAHFFGKLQNSSIVTSTPSPSPSPTLTSSRLTSPQHNTDFPIEDEHCGVPEIMPVTEALNKIIGGNEARKNSWPWQVSLRRKGPDGVFRHECGGTLVSRTKVVSAAHCLAYSEIATDYEVQLGAHILSETNKGRLVKVSKIDSPSGDNAKQQYPSDLMVITLGQSVTYDDTISPACFGLANIELDTVVCYVTGWGNSVGYNSTITSNYLKQLRAPIHKEEDCKKYIGHDFDPNLMMCDGSLLGDNDTCQVDSGGPLVCNVDQKWSLYGVVLFGKECAVRNSLTVYAKVNAHWKFLQEAMTTSTTTRPISILNNEIINAVEVGNEDTVQKLLDEGADVNARTIGEYLNETLLHIASEKGYENVVSLLIKKGANIEARSTTNGTPLHEAAYYGRVNVVSLLLDKGANIEAKDNISSTPLHNAAWNGHVNVVSLLLDKGANIEAKGPGKNTPLHYAAFYGHVNVVSLLLDKGANIEARNTDNNTPLHSAAFYGFANIVSLLLDKGANIFAKARWNNVDSTPLDLAKLSNKPEIVEILESKQRQLKTG